MRVSLQWLRELVPFHSAPELLAEKLSMAGFEVESDQDLAAQAAGVVLGRVLAKQAHPDATKLNVCQVEIGGPQPLQIVCGAANVREGMAVAVATVGSHLPAVDLTIKPAKLRGVESCGMLCSLAELGLEDEADGLVDLEAMAAANNQTLPGLGEAIGPLLGLDDRILELAITANRPDGLSMLGIAREVAALEQVELQAPPQAASHNSGALEDPGLQRWSSLFSLTALDGVVVAPSPRWLQKRLEAAGQRCVNNVVDITNLVMLETGQPLHAYDRDRLGEGEGEGNPSGFSLRPAHLGEQLITLDGSERSFSEENLLVTHANKPIALAGVMGGEASAVHNGSRRLLLEAAVFEPAVVRRSARKAGLRSESSARFERGVASAQTMAAADRAVALLCELAGATVVGRWQAGSAQPAPEPLLLRRSALEKLLGPLDGGEAGYVELEDREVESILERLGCQLERLEQEGEGWLVTVPASRCHDLLREVDLIEEVARLVGYDRFCSHLPDPLAPGGLSLEQALLRQLRAALRSCGMQELSHLSLVAQDADPEGQVALSNPLLADYGHLRTDLRQGLLEAATRNLQASQRGFWGFEIGRVFRQVDGEYEEEERLAGVFAGERCAELWSSSGQPQSLTYFQGRGYLTQALGSLGLTLQDRRAPADPMLHPGRSAQVLLEGRAIGIFAELHPALADRLDLPSQPLIFDLAVAPLLAAAARDKRACPLFQTFATVPASERDLAFVVSEQQELATVLQELRKTGGSLLELVELLDRYTGAPIPAGYCSLAVRLRFRDPQATLRDEQVEPLMEKLRHCITAKFKAELRG